MERGAAKQSIAFTKMHGCGNDYIYINCLPGQAAEAAGMDIEAVKAAAPALSVRMSDRHFGIGADGIILIEYSERADAYMHMFNADGSEGNMCGNGIRCVAKYLYDNGLLPPGSTKTRIDTKSGIREITLHTEGGEMREATVDMGEARLCSQLPEDITVRGMPLSFVGIDIGNPHAVYFLEDNAALGCRHVQELDLPRYGHAFEQHPRFPDRTNSEFIEVLSPSEIRFRVWERGSGETLACGTGASASVAAGNLLGKLEPEVLVHLPGGDLRIQYRASDHHCLMRGPAVTVFHGEWEAMP